MGGRQGRRWLARALGLALLLQMVVAPTRVEALDWHLPGRRDSPSVSVPGAEASPQRLQEVPPPAWVRKARLALEDRNPTVRILAPSDGEILPDGPWTLRMQAGDWPLVDAGPLGLGPHLVVQLDGEPPRPTVDTEIEMPPLSPGSHRLTVYAAKPWGEAHKSPLALRQIRIHRLAPNPATLPAPGTPQLIPVSPSGRAGRPPLLLDWLLIDTPLQGLRSDSAGWRLRLTVNGESVLVDQQTPLWLQGWKPGGNALLLELLDGRGDPLNPPFNSLLQEVVVSANGASGSAGAPADALTDLELAVLLGEQPLSALAPPPEADPGPEPPFAPEPPASPEPSPSPESSPNPEPPTTQELPNSPERPNEPERILSPDRPPASPDPPVAPEGPVSPEVSPDTEAAPLPEAAFAPPEDSDSDPRSLEPAPGLEPDTTASPAGGAGDAALPPATASGLLADVPREDAVVAAPTAAPVGTPRSARDEVNNDGTLRRPKRPSTLPWLRERLGQRLGQ